MTDEKTIRNDNVDKTSKPIYANTFRLGFTETEFIIDFGFRIDDDTVEELDTIAIPTKMMQNFILKLFGIARMYEKKFNTNIGFAEIIDGDKEEE
ncbi:hypothetical protein [Paramaledivibacter caminithermalis]|jgi:hypothetical protein|uniref:Uncharacterized protein n=1 Tax=Paramaledivibacter caminithermalis (strain DSM 15212 / CIP 107654 / DViRD3) TaxID=1121301 RepID=A0A1M6Q7T8_PARC5|nr:hypothetical protein [Paramaledivibacter caminithermalis]SHK16206.1 hypothetical protein SAMN02745912_02455 [Paramaledivibacter caminithermalis DSM 15212]